jgi:16S rRNA (cytosine967-C5)-methyltransferase
VLRKVAGMRAGERDHLPWADARDRLPMSHGASIPLSGVLLPEEPLERLSVATSHTQWLLKRWQAEHPGRMSELALHSLAAAPTLINTTYARSALPGFLAPHRQAGIHVFTGSHAELSELLAARSDLWVQDAASSLAVAGVSALQPRVIIDSCAGQGTKTRQLAAAFPEAEVIATDVDDHRYRVLEDLYRGHRTVRVVPRKDLLEFAGRADLVLLDVPCGNSGVLARRPEAKYRASNSQLKRLNGIQRQIVADSIPLLRESPRGRTLYSTCSIDREENRELVDWACKWHGFNVGHELLTLPAGLPGEPPEAYHDGSFSALLA